MKVIAVLISNAVHVLGLLDRGRYMGKTDRDYCPGVLVLFAVSFGAKG